MSEIMLDKLEVGEKCYIKELFLDKETKRRLRELGFLEKNLVKCILRSPFGEPKAYLIKDTVVSIRKDLAKKILVERI